MKIRAAANMSRGAAALKKSLYKPKKQSPFPQKFGCANVRAPAPKLFSLKGLARGGGRNPHQLFQRG